MQTKVLRTTVSSEVMIINDDGEVISTIETKPIVIYKGNPFNYEKYLIIVEAATLRAYNSGRSEGDRLTLSELLQTPPST